MKKKTSLPKKKSTSKKRNVSKKSIVTKPNSILKLPNHKLEHSYLQNKTVNERRMNIFFGFLVLALNLIVPGLGTLVSGSILEGFVQLFILSTILYIKVTAKILTWPLKIVMIFIWLWALVYAIQFLVKTSKKSYQ